MTSCEHRAAKYVSWNPAQIRRSSYDRHVDEQSAAIRRAFRPNCWPAGSDAPERPHRHDAHRPHSPRLALPQTDEPGEIARYLFGEGLPGEFPFVERRPIREMYLDRTAAARTPPKSRRASSPASGSPRTPTPASTILTKQQRSVRLSTAFDGPDALRPGQRCRRRLRQDRRGRRRDRHRRGHGAALRRLHARRRRLLRLDDDQRPGADHPRDVRRGGEAPLRRRTSSPSCAAPCRPTSSRRCRRRTRSSSRRGVAAVPHRHGRVLTTQHMPRWYPISISGYHIAEAGATPVQQAAYTLSNGFTYVELFRQRGMDVEQFGPRLSFFLDCGLDIEYLALARVCRKIWAIAMRDVFGADERAQLLQAPHPDQRPIARRARVQEQPDAHRGRADARLHQRHQLLPQQQRRRAVHHARRGIRAARRPRAGDPAGGSGPVQAHDEPAAAARRA